MNKEVERIRQSIRQRKKERQSKREPISFVRPEIITDEERHGFHTEPLYQNELSKKKKKDRSNVTSVFIQFFGALIFIAFTAFVFQSEWSLLDKPKKLLEGALTEPFPFATVYDWYVESLGEPIALTPKYTTPTLSDHGLIVPVVGEVIESFHVNGTGVEIMPTGEREVRAVEQGIVIFAGKTKEMDRTIKVQHPDRSVTTYGKLSDIHVHLFQRVSPNEIIGRVNPEETRESFFFSIEKQNGYVDPIDIINVDGKTTIENEK